MSESNDVQMTPAITTTTTHSGKFVISRVANAYEHHLPDIRIFLVKYLDCTWGNAEPTPTTKHLLWKWKRQGGANIPPHIFCLLLDAYCYRLDTNSPSRFDLRRGISKEPTDHEVRPLTGLRSKVTEREIKKSAAFALQSSEARGKTTHADGRREFAPFAQTASAPSTNSRRERNGNLTLTPATAYCLRASFARHPTCVCTATNDLLSPPHHHKCPVAILFEWVRNRKFAEPIERQSPLRTSSSTSNGAAYLRVPYR